MFRDRLAQLIALQQSEAVNDDDRPTRGETTMFAVLLLDLNGFKAVNDTYGHHVGDQLLQQVARRLESCVRSVDLVARMSGDEFNVLLESIDPAEASQRAEQIAAALAAPYVVGEHTVISGASIGLVSSASRLATVDDYLRAADAAMYRAKVSHRACACFNKDVRGDFLRGCRMARCTRPSWSGQIMNLPPFDAKVHCCGD